MRLAFDGRTIGDHYPGIGRYAFGLWRALGERVGTTIIDPALKNTRFKIEGATRTSFGVRSPLAQVDVPLKIRGADVYYSPYYLMPYVLPCPAVVTLYDATPLLGPGLPPLARLAYRLAHRLAGTAAKRVIVLSESAREEIVALGVPREKMVVCPPGLDPKFRPATKDEIARVRQKYSLPDEFWLCFGSRKWHKNTQAAVEAMRGRALAIAGNFRRGEPSCSPNTGPTHGSAPTINIPAITEEDLPAMYSVARGLVFPSLREGFGLPVIEAMACGTPVVCFPAPGVKEAAGTAAMMAEDMTTTALAEAVMQLDDPVVREPKVEAGLEWVKQFTWDKTIEAVLGC